MLSTFRSSMKEFLRDPRGASALLFALALPSLLILGGGAVDYAAIGQSRTRLQAAADSAALAIAREMTIGAMSAQRAQELATAHVNANLDSANAATVIASLTENGLAVKINATQPLVAPVGMIVKFSDAKVIEAMALARVTASSMQTKLCMLALAEKRDGGLFLHNNSYIAAPECVLHSNSTDRNAVIVQTGSKLQANLVCARGGIANSAGIVQANLLTDCPAIPDPLAKRPEPSGDGPCNHSKLNIGGAKAGAQKGSAPAMVSVTLNPGVYCDGVTIEGNARVTLNPGIYVIRNGPFVVRANAELVGKGVTLLLTGRRSYFRFLENALVQISAPVSGVAAGMLIWESRRFSILLTSWQNSGCDEGENDDDDDDNNNSKSCNSKAKRVLGQIPKKKTNEHHINADRARELTGTIYLPNGLLLIDSRRPVADQSPFTVLVASKVDLFDGPNLVLNANYGGTTVPVPAGLGAIGATQVRLGMPGQANPTTPPPR